MSSAPERRIVFSRMRESSISVSVGRRSENAGEGIGLSSQVMRNWPSVGRSGGGFITSAEV